MSLDLAVNRKRSVAIPAFFVEKQEEILAEPVNHESQKADRVISAIDVILQNLTGDLVAQISPVQGLVLSGKLDELEKHLKTYQAKDAEVV